MAIVNPPPPPPYPGWDLEQSPFHEGELAVQERVGVREKIDALGRRAVRRYLTPQHREFFPALPYVFIGSVDREGRPWASMIFGQPGFVSPNDEFSLKVRSRPLFADPLEDAWRDGSEIALLGIQLHTRRRNRVFGVATQVGDTGFTLAIRQTIGICPQYIHGREPKFTADPLRPEPRPVHRSAAVTDKARRIIEKADVYFVASVNPRAADGVTSGADVSHRGGRPGFVRIDDERTLTAPDFVGNFLFNTLGNWQIDNRAGLLFLDFSTGTVAYVAARAEVIWDGPEIKAFAGAQRLVRYHVDEVVLVENSLPATFTAPDYSPLNERTGTWEDVQRALDADRLRSEWRPFRIVRIEDEAEQVRSFYLVPDDGSGFASYEAGQYLPIRLFDGESRPVLRTYSLSTASGGSAYRISVKREGLGGTSDWLHDKATVGSTIETLAPRGAFLFDSPPRRPVVLLSAGVGITPMVAIIDSLLINDGRTRHHAPIWFIHGARNGVTHAFSSYLREKAALHANLHLHTVYSQPRDEDRLGETHDSNGRIDVAMLKRILPFDDFDFYLCGPTAFMQSLYDGLTELGVRDERIRFESFGPTPVRRRIQEASVGSIAAATDEEAVQVTFARSGKSARWVPRIGSLLDLAEANGISPLHSCRTGICGTCTTRVLSGAVEYDERPAHELTEGEALICCGTPKAGPHIGASLDREGIVLDL